MEKLIAFINNGEYEKAYNEIFVKGTKSIDRGAFDFLYHCVPTSAYAYLQFCLGRNEDVVLRFSICEFLSYGDIVIENSHAIVHDIIASILVDRPGYLPALEFVVYNYFEHPDSPFSDAELISCAKGIISNHFDRVAKKVLDYYNVCY